MSDLISREEAARRLETQAEKWKGSFSGEAFEFAAKIVRGVPSATDNNVGDKMDFCGELCIFAEGLIQKAREPKWIPVTERLPERYKYVLLWDAMDRDIFNGVLDDKCEWYIPGYRDETFDITHWMPLPEPPKEG